MDNGTTIPYHRPLTYTNNLTRPSISTQIGKFKDLKESVIK